MNTAAVLDYEVIDSIPGMARIENEWSDLWERSQDRFVTYSHQVTKALAAYPLRRRHEKLWCITGRRNGALVLVWPFVIYRHFVWRMASAIADTIDYSDPLMDEALDKQQCISDAIRVILAWCPCDLVQFQFVKRTSTLSGIVPTLRGCVSTYTTDIPQVIFEGTWSDYENSRSRSEQGKRRVFPTLARLRFVR